VKPTGQAGEDREGGSDLLSVSWYADLVSGKGASQGMSGPLRDQLLAATAGHARAVVDAQRRVAHERARAAQERATAEEKAKAAAAEAERRAVQQRERAAAARAADAKRHHAAVLNQARAARRVGLRSKYWTTLQVAVWTCVTVLVPWVVGRFTRDGGFRPRSAEVIDVSVRKAGSYFLTDGAAGAAIVVALAGVAMLIIALVGLRFRLSFGYMLLALGMLGGALELAHVSSDRWNSAESGSAQILDATAIPSDRALCSGTPTELGQIFGSKDETFRWDGAWWTAALRDLTPVDAEGAAEVGVCVYSGWHYVTTISFGVIPGMDARTGDLHVAVGDNAAGIYLATAADDGTSGTIYGAALPPSVHGASSAGRDAASAMQPWTLDTPDLGSLTVSVGPGPYLVLGKWATSTVGNVYAVGTDGVVTVLAKDIPNFGYVMDEHAVAIVLGWVDGVGGSAVRFVGPDLSTIAELACPDGSPVVREQYSELFRCGAGVTYYTDLASATWVQG
jgi:hypothetical protein